MIEAAQPEEEPLPEPRAALLTDDIAYVKAKTMFGIVDEYYSDRQISGAPTRVLFLSPRQTELIANDRSAIARMIFDGFQAPSPGMFIQLLFSTGFDSPCPSDKDMSDCTDKLDRFMAEVVIPLAAENRAVVFTSADRRCGLSESFSRVVSLMRTKWGDRLPFTVLSVVPDLLPLYTNPNPSAHWRKVRDASAAWRARSPHLRQLVNAQIQRAAAATPGGEAALATSDADLSALGSNFLLFDRSSERELLGHSSETANALLHSMRTYLTSDAEGLGLPSLAFKAGNACFLGLKNWEASAQQYASTLQPALDVMQGGTPLMLIDGCEARVASNERGPASMGRMCPHTDPHSRPDPSLTPSALLLCVRPRTTHVAQTHGLRFRPPYAPASWRTQS